MIGKIGAYVSGIAIDKSRAATVEVRGAPDNVPSARDGNSLLAKQDGSVSISSLAGQLADSAGVSAEKTRH